MKARFAVDGVVVGSENTYFPVPGTLAHYNEEFAGAATVCAAFHVLGQEILKLCSPKIAADAAIELLDVRNRVLAKMKNDENAEVYEWTHLGDGVYIAFDKYHTIVRVNDPNDTNEPTIYLDPYVLEAFIEIASGHLNGKPALGFWTKT